MLPRLQGRQWRTLRAAILNRSHTCHLCGQPIDLTLSGLHPQGPTVDHITPISAGGHPTNPDNLAAAHRTCNLRKGDRDKQTSRGTLAW